MPGSFPSQLAAEPSQEVGQRRFIIMDDNVYRLYGEKVETVGSPWCINDCVHSIAVSIAVNMSICWPAWQRMT